MENINTFGFKSNVLNFAICGMYTPFNYVNYSHGALLNSAMVHP